MNRLERAFNLVNDADWTWGPWLRLRPPPDVKMGGKYCLAVWLPMVLFGAVATVVALALLWTYSPNRPPHLGPSLPLFISLLGWAFRHDSGAWLTVAGLSSLMIGVFVWAWNRRAGRLRQQPAVSELPLDSPDSHEVWPPLPTTGRP